MCFFFAESGNESERDPVIENLFQEAKPDELPETPKPNPSPAETELEKLRVAYTALRQNYDTIASIPRPAPDVAKLEVRIPAPEINNPSIHDHSQWASKPDQFGYRPANLPLRNAANTASAPPSYEPQDRSLSATLLTDRAENPVSHTRSITTLLAMPRKRNLQTQPNRSINFNRPVNEEAALGHTRGEVQDPGCLTCENGNGIFTKCVTVRGLWKGSCSNCQYNSEAARCTLRRT